MASAPERPGTREPEVARRPVETPRGTLGRIAFRFGATYLALYVLPWSDTLISWVGRHVLGLEISGVPTGSGDTMYHWVGMLVGIAVATLGCVVWTLAERGRTPDRLHALTMYGLTVLVRYHVATLMVHYGVSKVLGWQFLPPTLDRLMQPLGESSPMGLAWTFMGFSPVYSAFTGLAELVGGTLLLWRRTTTLGALIVVAVMSNVVVLDFAYDIPVKQLSIHLLAMALLLLWLDRRRLLGVFFGRGVAELPSGPPFVSAHANVARRLAKAVFIASAIAVIASTYLRGFAQRDALERRGAPLRGIYDIDTFAIDGEPRFPVPTDGRRWHRMVCNRYARCTVTFTDGKMRRFRAVLDSETSTLTLHEHDAATELASIALAVTRPGPEILVLQGDFDGDRIRATLRHRDDIGFRLTTRAFHWISEKPFHH